MGTTFERDESGATVLDRRPEPELNTAQFEEFYHRYQPALLRYATSRNAVDPEGVVHLALLDGFGALDRMRSTDPRSVRAYLFRAVLSHTAMEHRRGGGEQVGFGGEVRSGDGFEDSVIGHLEFDRALAMLPHEQRAVLRLRFADDLSADEIGRVLGKTATAVRQLQFRGIRRLRRVGFTAAMLLILVGAVLIVWRQTGPQPSMLEPAEQQDVDADEQPLAETIDEQLVDAVTVDGRPQLDLRSDGQRQQPDPVDSAATTASDVVTQDDVPASSPPPPLPADQPEEPALTEPPALTSTQVEPPLPADASVQPSPPPPAAAQVYEGFDLSITGAAVAGNPSVSSFGFGDTTTWAITRGEGTAVHEPVGLQYADGAGNALLTSPGAVRFSATASGTHLARPLATSPGDTYWAAFLLRPDSEGYGDAYWSPDGYLDRGAVGIQQYGQLRYVNGPVTDTAFEVGRTYLLVVQVQGTQSSLWINPDLTGLGTPDATYNHEQVAVPERLILVTNEFNDGAYTFDEVRLGSSFEAVAPMG